MSVFLGTDTKKVDLGVQSAVHKQFSDRPHRPPPVLPGPLFSGLAFATAASPFFFFSRETADSNACGAFYATG